MIKKIDGYKGHNRIVKCDCCGFEKISPWHEEEKIGAPYLCQLCKSIPGNGHDTITKEMLSMALNTALNTSIKSSVE